MNRSLFKRLAERHQEEFKKNVLHLDKCGVFRNPSTKEQVPVQRFLTYEDAEAGMIFYEGFRKESKRVKVFVRDTPVQHADPCFAARICSLVENIVLNKKLFVLHED